VGTTSTTFPTVKTQRHLPRGCSIVPPDLGGPAVHLTMLSAFVHATAGTAHLPEAGHVEDFDGLRLNVRLLLDRIHRPTRDETHSC
jgi:hypothetical protein